MPDEIPRRLQGLQEFRQPGHQALLRSLNLQEGLRSLTPTRHSVP